MRQDRDKFVEIVWKNILAGKEDQFEKCDNCDNQELKYDVSSIMHYSEYAFSKSRKDGLVTIRVKDESGTKIGQRNGFSSLDVIGLNKLYCPGFKAKCADNDETCASKANDCEDEQKKDWMYLNCAGTCKICVEPKCEDKYDTTIANPQCPGWKNYCKKFSLKVHVMRILST